MANGFTYESPLNRLLNVTVPRLIEGQLEREQRQREFDEQMAFREIQFEAAERRRDQDQANFERNFQATQRERDRNFEANQRERDRNFAAEQKVRDKKIEAAEKAEQLSSDVVVFNELKTLGVDKILDPTIQESFQFKSPVVQRQFNVLKNKAAEYKKSRDSLLDGMPNVAGLQEYWVNSDLYQNPNTTSNDISKFIKDYLSIQGLSDSSSQMLNRISGIMNNRATIISNLEGRYAQASLMNDSDAMEMLRNELNILKSKQRMDLLKSENLLSKSGIKVDGIIGQERETKEPTGRFKLQTFTNRDGSKSVEVVDTDTNIATQSRGIVEYTPNLINSGYTGVTKLGDKYYEIDEAGALFEVPADYDPLYNADVDKVIVDEESAIRTADKIFDYEMPVDYPGESDSADAMKRLATVQREEPGGLQPLDTLSDLLRGASSVESRLGTGEGGILSLGGATATEIDAVKNVRDNIKTIKQQMFKALGDMTTVGTFQRPSVEEYKDIIASKNEELKSYIRNIYEAIPTASTNRVKKFLQKVLKDISNDIKAQERRGDRTSLGGESGDLGILFDAELIAMIRAIESGQPLESIQ